MIIRESKASELEKITQIEQQTHASEFVNKLPLKEHQDNFEKDEIVYLSIVDSTDRVAGFLIWLVNRWEDPLSFVGSWLILTTEE